MVREARLPHSAGEFDVRRNYMWNPDFLVLMSQRWALARVGALLDVGCGVGHWTALLSPLLPASATLIGVDREPTWIGVATEVARMTGREERTRFQVASAEALPFPDGAFDMVTCQMLLIHVADVTVVLREMMRVLRPGGLLAVVEPNNLIQTLVPTSTTWDDEPENVVARVRFQMRCERGRRRLGDGDISVGDRLPGLMSELGLGGISVFVSDKASALVPPYADDEQRAFTEPAFEGPATERWLWARDESLRYFLAGGGTDAEFTEGWDAVAIKEPTRLREAYRAKTLARAGGRLIYLVSGRR